MSAGVVGRDSVPPAAPEPGHVEPVAPVITGLPQVTRAAGIILGSTTVLSGFLFYFGWARAYYFYDYFGVDSSLLGLSTRDYLQLSVDGLFVPLTVVAAVALAVLWAWPLLRRVVQNRRRAAFVRVAGPVVGALLLLNGMSAILVQTRLNRPLAVAPLCLASGTVLLVLSFRHARGGASVAVAVTQWSVIVVLGGLSLFWVANDYSAAVGRSRAREMTAELPAFPDATLYSEKGLSLRHPGLRETRCADEDAGYAFRYDGLKLILQSGDQYLFLPATWSREEGVTLVMPRAGTRLEFRQASAAAAAPVRC